MSALPSKNSPFHGGIRGADFDQRSSHFEGRFGRMFRSLPAAQWPEAALRELAGDGLKENRMAAERWSFCAPPSARMASKYWKKREIRHA